MVDPTKILRPGDACPVCHHSPLYDDAGFTVCSDCGAEWDQESGEMSQDDGFAQDEEEE